MGDEIYSEEFINAQIEGLDSSEILGIDTPVDIEFVDKNVFALVSKN